MDEHTRFVDIRLIVRAIVHKKGHVILTSTNSRNLAAIQTSTSGIETTLSRAKTFRRQLRFLLDVPKSGSVVKTVRALKAELEAASSAMPSAKLVKANKFRKQLRNILGVPKSGSVVKAVRALKTRNDVLEGRQSTLAAMLSEIAA